MKGRILIADDEQIILSLLENILQQEGYDVQSVNSGEKALEVLRNELYDLFILDIIMPGIDGLEVLRNAKLLSPDLRIILLTGHGSLETAIEALRQGAHDYILKPVLPNEILSSVSRALARRAEQVQKRLLLEQIDTSVKRLRDAEGFEQQLSVEAQTIVLEDGVLIDLARREVWRGNLHVSLTPTEGKLMKILLENRGRVIPHRDLVFMLHGYESTEWEAPEVLRPLISRLRRKLSVFPNGENWISNVRGTGYVFDRKKEISG